VIAGRREWLRGALAAAFAPLLGSGCTLPARPGAPLGFAEVPPSLADTIAVPEGYTVEVLARWGDAVGIAGAPMPVWRDDAGDDATAQGLQFGMHHDGLQYLPIGHSSAHGLLVVNHEYTDDGLLHPGGMAHWSAAKVAKAQAAHGLSVAEVRRDGAGRWQLVRPSPFARRITATTPLNLSGPAAGHPLLRTAADPAGRQVLGTLANCGSGLTPWGTVLVAEENWAWYFAAGGAPSAAQRRWGIGETSWLRWEVHDDRFDLRRHPNEAHRFGWLVEVDPFDPHSVPVKRTALGRAAHEGAAVAVTRDGRAVVYSGEDARNQCIHKFVSRARIAPGGARANASLLDHGTLYAARFDALGRGRWLALEQGRGGLDAAAGFPDQSHVLVGLREAADRIGATPMDRPEWIAVHPHRVEVFCALTGNDRRGAPGQPGADAANPRAPNPAGHLLRWQEEGDFDAETFGWQVFALAGVAAAERYACPDSLTFDPAGRLWIGTDVGPDALHPGAFGHLGNNQLLACDIGRGDVRRFLTGPVNAEITSPCFTPDGRTLFVDIQHPGEPRGERSDPAAPRALSNWPDFHPHGRPRSATVAIRRRDGGLIGS